MESLSRNGSGIIDFIAHKKHIEKERTIREDPKMHLVHFLEWAYDSTKPESANNHPTEGTPDSFEAHFNNGKVKGRLTYERSVSQESDGNEESLLFQELGRAGRNIGYKAGDGYFHVFYYIGDPQAEAFFMEPDEIVQFLAELGAPYKHNDPFPFALEPAMESQG